MQAWEDRLADAVELVNRSREIVSAQSRRLEQARASGGSTQVQADMLALYEAALQRRQKRLDALLASAPISAEFRPR